MSESKNLNHDGAFLRRLMLVVDGSRLSDEATYFAFRLAKRLECELEAVYSVDTATMDYLLQMHIFVTEEREDFEQAIEEKGRNYVERVQRLAEASGVEVETKILRGRFHQTILDYARICEADAIILGGWGDGRGHAKDTFSVERELIMKLAERPVFVIKTSRAGSAGGYYY